MIQRIQTVFLLFATIFALAIFFVPVVYVSSGESLFLCSFFAKNLLAILIVAAFAALFSFAAIFFYKKRKLQIYLCIVAIILIISYFALLIFFFYKTENYRPGILLLLPVISLIFNVLAIKKIRADEKLVRSLNRIR